MKINGCFVLFVCYSFFSVGQAEFHHCYMEERSFSIGGAYSTEFIENEHLINGRAYFNPTESICFGPEYSYLFSPHTNYQEIGIAAHYIFDLKIVGLFPLIGINYGKEKDDHGIHESWGFKSGFGIHRNFNRWIAFTEGGVLYNKFETSPFLSIGLMLMFKTEK